MLSNRKPKFILTKNKTTKQQWSEKKKEKTKSAAVCVCVCGFFWFFNHLPERLYPWHVFSPSLSPFRLISITLVVWIKYAASVFGTKTKTGCLLQVWDNPIFGGRLQHVYIKCVNLFNGSFQSTFYQNRCADN